MTVVIKKEDPIEKKQEKLNLLQKKSLNKKQKTFTELCGSLKGVFKEDAVVIQRRLRDEWQ
ncbi:MAG: hypothetical protein ABI594_14715 [Ginsengibacter sp.]